MLGERDHLVVTVEGAEDIDLAFEGDDASVHLVDVALAFEARNHAVELIDAFLLLAQLNKDDAYLGFGAQRLGLVVLLTAEVGLLGGPTQALLVVVLQLIGAGSMEAVKMLEDGVGFNIFGIPLGWIGKTRNNGVCQEIEAEDPMYSFAFKEVQAEDRMEMIEESAKLSPFYTEIKERMTNLNLAILTIQGLSTAYQIGAAYFLKLENYITSDEKIGDDSWKSLWDNHLYGLLFEYLRGLPNAEEDLCTLHRAYNLEDKYKIENRKVIKESSQDA
jgi:hypothetical protein